MLKVQMFHAACREVMKHAKNDWAKAYAQRGLEYSDPQDMKDQAIYILSNTQHWTGDKAKQVKTILRNI